jgi:hypothetical protein
MGNGAMYGVSDSPCTFVQLRAGVPQFQFEAGTEGLLETGWLTRRADSLAGISQRIRSLVKGDRLIAEVIGENQDPVSGIFGF